jgi:hypothetical protein
VLPADPGEVVRSGQAVAAGCIPLEYVGVPAPSTDPRVQNAIMRGTLTAKQFKRLEAAQAHAETLIPGKCKRTFGPDGPRPVPGLSMRYTWGPKRGTYVIAVRRRDADILMDLVGHLFIDRSVVLGSAPIVLPRPDLVKVVNRTGFRTIDAYREAVGR